MRNLAAIFLIALSVSPALALTPEQIAQQQLVIQQQQEQALQNERNRQQVIEAERVRESRDREEKSDKSALGAGTDTDECPRFNRVIVYGNKKFSDRRIAKITDSYVGRCVNRANMENIQKELTDLYIDRKYTLARVYFDQRNSKLTKTDCDIILTPVFAEGNKEAAFTALVIVSSMTAALAIGGVIASEIAKKIREKKYLQKEEKRRQDILSQIRKQNMINTK